MKISEMDGLKLSLARKLVRRFNGPLLSFFVGVPHTFLQLSTLFLLSRFVCGCLFNCLLLCVSLLCSFVAVLEGLPRERKYGMGRRGRDSLHHLHGPAKHTT